jgi:hypothetical protein
VFLAWLAALTFFVALIDLVVDWRRRAWAHSNSATRLGELSVTHGQALPDAAEDWTVDGVDLAIEYERVMGLDRADSRRQGRSHEGGRQPQASVFTLIDAQPGITVADRWRQPARQSRPTSA